jgi:signal transduction histidine kinase
MSFLPILLPLMTIVLTAFMGSFVVKQRRTRPNVAFFFMCLSAALVSFFLLKMEWSVARGEVPLPWHNLYDATLAVFLLSTVFFSFMFPKPTPHASRILAPFTICAAGITGVSLVGGNFSQHNVLGDIHTFEPTLFFRIYIVYAIASLGTMIGVLLYKYRMLRSAQCDRPAQMALKVIVMWFSLAIIIGLQFSLVEVVILKSMKHFYLQIGGFLIYTVATFYSIVRYNAFDIETVLHKTLSWFILSLGPVAVIFGAAIWLRPNLENASNWQWAAAISGISCMAGLYLHFAQPYVDQLFDRRKYDLAKTLDEVISDLAVLQELQPMALRILNRVCQVLTVHGGAAMILDPEKKHLVVVARKELDMSDSIALDESILQAFEMGSMAEFDPTHDGEAKDRSHSEWFRIHSFALCLPLVQKDELIGILVFGRKRNLGRFSQREKAFLAKIGTAVTIAFSNSLLLERERELDRLKTEFLSEVAHELRGPLSGIASIAEGVLMRNTDKINEDQKRMVESIRITAVEVKNLVDHLLDLSKINLGVMTYDFRGIDIAAVVRLAADLARASISTKNLDLAIDIEENLPIVEADKTRIRQCLTNLLSNAIKYTEHGTIRVTCLSEGEGIRVTIEDTGRGMTEEEIKNVFERFRRGKKVGAIEGSGLGLTLTKEIIEAHGGKIEVESRQGVGSRFSFYLPGTPPDGSKPGTRPAMRIRPILQPKTIAQTKPAEVVLSEIEIGHGETLIVIDDSEMEREALRAVLENRGYRVLTATNGLEGLELIKSSPPDLVITDLIMPQMTGPELCSIVKKDLKTAHIPIIMLTARDTDEDLIRGIETGADDYVAKPYNIRVLSARISALLRRQRIRDSLEKERRHAEELEKKHHQVNSILNNKNYLIMQLAHELRTPLTGLICMVGNLNDEIVGPLTPRQKEYLTDITGATDRIKRLITDLLCFAMAEAGTLRLQPREIRIGDVIREVLNAVQAIQEQDRVQCAVGDSTQNKCAYADPDRLQQILLNLIHNAINASPSGSRVFIDARDGDCELIVSVRDSGPGISPEEQAKLLREPVLSGKSQGSGFGLYITRYLVELHGGKIWFDSKLGSGATFYFTLPKHR